MIDFKILSLSQKLVVLGKKVILCHFFQVLRTNMESNILQHLPALELLYD